MGAAARSGDPLYYMVKLGIYADWNYCSQWPAWSTLLLYLVNDVNSLYNSQVNTMLLVVDGPECITGSDSWSSDTDTLIDQFNKWCAGDSGCASAEEAHLVSGKDLSRGGDTSIIGAGMEPGKVSVLEGNWGTITGRKRVASHEIGHNLWGDHAYADATYTLGCPIPPGGTIMLGLYVDDCSMKDYFSAANRKAITGQIRYVTTNWLPYTEQTSTSNDGFYATKWWVRYPRVPTLNSQITAHFLFMNPTYNTVTISNIFIGCRNGPGQQTNCDFGYTGQVVLGPLTSREVTVSRQVGVLGLWQFWPAYYYNGHYGPYQWAMVQTPVVNAQVGHYGGPDTSPGGVKLINFNVWAPSSTVHVGDTLFVEYTYWNTLTAHLDFDPYGIFVGARDPSGGSRDFGLTTLRLWGSQSTSTCQGCFEATTMTASITVSSTGSWVFWPAYYLNGNWGPYQWHKLTVSVSP